MVEKMAYANRDTGNVLGAAETARLTEYLDLPASNPKQSRHWALDIAVALPTRRLTLSPGGFSHTKFWPVTLNRTRRPAQSRDPDTSRLTPNSYSHVAKTTAHLQ